MCFANSEWLLETQTTFQASLALGARLVTHPFINSTNDYRTPTISATVPSTRAEESGWRGPSSQGMYIQRRANDHRGFVLINKIHSVQVGSVYSPIPPRCRLTARSSQQAPLPLFIRTSSRSLQWSVSFPTSKVPDKSFTK